MPDQDAFLRAICENPDDDVPRLVYADWLEEHGDPRGEYIRLSCFRSKLPESDVIRRRELTQRIDELQIAFENVWRERLPHAPGVIWGPHHRGFVNFVIIEGKDTFLRDGERLFAATPIEFVLFRDLGPDGVRAIVDSPLLARLRSIELYGNNLGDDGTQSLARCPYLCNLWELLLNNNLIGNAGARALADSRYLGKLRMLFLHTNQIGDDGARALAASRWLPRRMTLCAKDNNLHAQTIDELRSRFDRVFA